ncbi:MAG: hypothetical protein AB7S38_09280 [Vulcanimicrobiota bacterium]
MKKVRNTGIVLIGVMLMALLVAMYVAAATAIAPQNFGLVRSGERDTAAEAAALSGRDYALARLQVDPNWRGDANAVVVETPELVVVEDHGNVIGLIRSGSLTSQFRLRFNYQDGGGGEDGMDDPTLTIDNPHLSVNNLMASLPAPIPIADGPGWSVDGNQADHPVPAHCVALVVEGVSSSELTGATSANPNPTLHSATRRVIESIHQIDELQLTTTPVEDAASMSGAKFSVELQGSGQVELASASDAAPRIRSKAELEVTNGGPVNLEATSTSAGELLAKSTITANEGANVNRGVESNDDFYRVAWDQLKKADSTNDTVPAGVYVFWEADSSFHYYDMNYEDYVDAITANPGLAGSVVTGGPLGLGTNASGKPTLRITDSVYVESTLAGTQDLTVIPRHGAAEQPPSPGTPVDISSAPTYLAANPADLQDFLSQVASNGQYTSPYGSGQLNWDIPSGTVVASGSASMLLSELFSGQTFTAVGGAALTNPPYTSGPGTSVSNSAANTYISATYSSGGVAPEELQFLNEASVSDSITPQDLQFEIDPTGEYAAVTSEGDIRIGGRLKGEGASLIAGGQIRLAGLGIDLAANPGAVAEGFSLYSREDIVIAPLQKVGTSYDYFDVKLKGVVYSWGDFIGKLGHDDVTRWGKLNIQGTVIAYGGDPSVEQPGDSSLLGGHITVKAEAVKFVLAPSYLLDLANLNPAGLKLLLISQSER